MFAADWRQKGVKLSQDELAVRQVVRVVLVGSEHQHGHCIVEPVSGEVLVFVPVHR